MQDFTFVFVKLPVATICCSTPPVCGGASKRAGTWDGSPSTLLAQAEREAQPLPSRCPASALPLSASTSLSAHLFQVSASLGLIELLLLQWPKAPLMRQGSPEAKSFIPTLSGESSLYPTVITPQKAWRNLKYLQQFFHIHRIGSKRRIAALGNQLIFQPIPTLPFPPPAM